MKKTYLTQKLPLIVTLISILSCSDDPIPEVTENEENTPIVVVSEDQLPQIEINTLGITIEDEYKIDAVMTISEDETETFNGKIAIETRGSSSQTFPKKSYGFETRDATNEDLDVAFFDFPEEEDWILYAPYSDKTLIRNILMHDLSKDIGRYSSRTKFVEVSINDSYKGIYILMEKLKRDKNRININKLKIDENSGTSVTGGYILKIDKSDIGEGAVYNSTNSFVSKHHSNNAYEKVRFLYDYPSKDKITTQQKNYISSYVANFEDALASVNFTNPTIGYDAYINTESFIDYFLLTELSNNVDGFRISTWLVKDKNEKLSMGPLWDYNLAFGNDDFCNNGATNVWQHRQNERCGGGGPWPIPFWWERLLEDPNYKIKLKERWLELRGGALSESNILRKIDTYQKILTNTGALERNFNTWPILGEYIWPNIYVGNTYQEEITHLEDWIKDRIYWLDISIKNL